MSHPDPTPSDPKSDKTPVSLLQELCVKRNLLPQYELLSSEGVVHEPVFLYRVQVLDIISTGSAKSKRLAKQFAARSCLEKLLTSPRHSDLPLPPSLVSLSTSEALDHIRSLLPDESKPPDPPSTSTEEESESAPGNPIGRLQELSTRRRWSPPIYTLCSSPKGFSTSIKLGKFEEKGIFHLKTMLKMIGEGRSKKIAKRIAAERMLQFLNKIPQKNSEAEEDELSEHIFASPRIEELDEHFRQLRSGSVLPEHVPEMSKPASLNALTTIELRSLQDLACLRTLFEIAKGQGWPEPTFLILSQLNKLGRFQCLVQIASTPVAVCYGSGQTQDAAKTMAARKALEYLKIVMQGDLEF